MFPLPVWFHYMLGWFVERIMAVPLVSIAQVRMLSEGLSEPTQPCELLPAGLAPKIAFNEKQIRDGLPPAGRFQLHDIRRCQKTDYTNRLCRRKRTGNRVFLDMP